jgi:dienelactone hydrolase
VLEAFGLLEYTSAQPDEISVTPVNYTGDDGQALTGFLAMPGDEWKRPLPAVVIFPDWDGNNQYEKERATALAAEGYVAFAGDIYGSDKLEVEDMNERIELVTLYASNPELYVSRMQNAIDQVKNMTADVNSEEIAIIGYCFGGSGACLLFVDDSNGLCCVGDETPRFLLKNNAPY